MVPSGSKRGRKRKEHRVVSGHELKHCSRCDSWLALNAFTPSTSPRRWDRLQTICTSCTLAGARAWRKRRAASLPAYPLDTIKECSRCGTPKPLTEYRRCSQGTFGRQSCCRQCSDSYQESWRDRARNKRLAYNRDYYSSPRGREVIAGWHERNPGKRRAQYLMKQAVNRGELVKPEACETCDAVARLDGHHPDYAKPLEVMWLCRTCHKAWHRKHGEGLNAQSARG